MQWTDRIRQVKIVLSVVATIICAVSLIWSHFLVRDLALEEERNMEVWAEAMRSLNQADESTDLSLVLKVINSNNTIPIVVLSSDGTVQTFRNLRIRHAETEADTLAFVGEKGRRMKADGNHIRVYLDESDYMEICYDESIMIKRMASYPYILLGVALIFAVVALIALTSSKRAEQNKVWVGLSKETAHQLGTPLSSLVAWNRRRPAARDGQRRQTPADDCRTLLEDRFTTRAAAREPERSYRSRGRLHQSPHQQPR